MSLQILSMCHTVRLASSWKKGASHEPGAAEGVLKSETSTSLTRQWGAKTQGDLEGDAGEAWRRVMPPQSHSSPFPFPAKVQTALELSKCDP